LFKNNGGGIIKRTRILNQIGVIFVTCFLLSVIICCNGEEEEGVAVSSPETSVDAVAHVTASPRTGDDPTICGMCGYTGKIDVITGTTYTINNLPKGIYYFSLTTYDENGIEGTFSSEMVRTISSTTGSAIISWSASSEPEVAGYKIYYGKSQ
jgi:hypothetical protein